MIGALLIAAGLIETVAGALRREVRTFAMAAGGSPRSPGCCSSSAPRRISFRRVVPIIGWLLIRSVILARCQPRPTARCGRWTAFRRGWTSLLAVLLIAGLSISTIVVSVFGPTPELIASFAWVLAASFVVNGLMLLEVASCDARARRD